MKRPFLHNQNSSGRKFPLARPAIFAALAAFLAISSSAQTAKVTQPTQSRYALSAGCGKEPAATGLTKVASKDGKQVDRTYLLLVPKNYSPQKTYSLVLVFHGAGASAEASMSWGLQNATGAADSAIFIFPQGIQYFGGQSGWDESPRGYDMPFVENMLSEAETGYCIDTDEVFVEGFSWGGDFTMVLGCTHGDSIRAMAVNSAGDEFKVKTDPKTYRYLPCASHVHPAVRFEHAIDGDSAYPKPEFATTAQFLANQSQCSGDSKPTASSTTQMTCRAFEGCYKKYVECAFDVRIGHGFPPNWAQDTWDFFASFRKPDRDVSHYR